MLTLRSLHVYPVKSLAGISLGESPVEGHGLRFDRRWMVVDPEGKFLTQREHPRMAAIATVLAADGLRLRTAGADEFVVPLPPAEPERMPERITVQVWRSTCEAAPAGARADAWLSAVLGTPCRLVYMPDATRRAVNPQYAVADDVVSFADGYPYLLIGEASLADLNTRLASPLPMNRFRPNFVVAGSTAFAEDGWSKIRIGGVLFHVVKSCDRCMVTTIDQATGERAGKEPLKTLATYRAADGKVFFGRHLISAGAGTVRVGDEVEVVAGAPAV